MNYLISDKSSDPKSNLEIKIGNWILVNCDHQICQWENCIGLHLLIAMPYGGNFLDTSSRARDCSWREDRRHRCWILEGSMPFISLTKNGLTCQCSDLIRINYTDHINHTVSEWQGYIRQGLIESLN